MFGADRQYRVTAISVSELVKTFGSTRALDGLDLSVETGEVTGSSDRTARASPPPSASCSACCAPTAGDVELLGGDPWRDAVELHRRLAYVPGDVNLWPKLTGGEVIDLLGRLRGDLDRAPARRAARAVRARPDQEGAHLLEGQPPEGRPRRGAGVERRAADPRRADRRASTR